MVEIFGKGDVKSYAHEGGVITISIKNPKYVTVCMNTFDTQVSLETAKEIVGVLESAIWWMECGQHLDADAALRSKEDDEKNS